MNFNKLASNHAVEEGLANPLRFFASLLTVMVAVKAQGFVLKKITF